MGGCCSSTGEKYAADGGNTNSGTGASAAAAAAKASKVSEHFVHRPLHQNMPEHPPIFRAKNALLQVRGPSDHQDHCVPLWRSWQAAKLHMSSSLGQTLPRCTCLLNHVIHTSYMSSIHPSIHPLPLIALAHIFAGCTLWVTQPSCGSDVPFPIDSLTVRAILRFLERNCLSHL